jgi:hypothetical protein
MSLRWKDSVILGTNYLINIKGMTQICLAMGAEVLYKYFSTKKLRRKKKAFPLVQWYTGTRSELYQKSEKHM